MDRKPNPAVTKFETIELPDGSIKRIPLNQKCKTDLGANPFWSSNWNEDLKPNLHNYLNEGKAMPRTKARRKKVTFYATVKKPKRVKVTFYARRKTKKRR